MGSAVGGRGLGFWRLEAELGLGWVGVKSSCRSVASDWIASLTQAPQTHPKCTPNAPQMRPKCIAPQITITLTLQRAPVPDDRDAVRAGAVLCAAGGGAAGAAAGVRAGWWPVCCAGGLV